MESFLDLITEKCNKTRLTHKYELKEYLQSFSGQEKLMVAKHFCKTEWNIGSLHILSILQNLRILTATEYILSQSNVEEIQLILNDFLEAEFDLITNLFITSFYDLTYGIRITSVLDECLRRLFCDLIQNPNINDLSYLKSLKEAFPGEHSQKIIQKHLTILLEMKQSNIKEAYRNYSKWINEGVDDLKLPKELFIKLISDNVEDTLNYLFRISTREHFREWKFYLIILQTISSNCQPEYKTFIRNYLKTRFRQIASFSNKEAMLHLLLTARASTATTLNIINNIHAYADWYKQNIGEMKFILETEQFQNVLKLLEQCIDFEMENDYLEIHSKISISPPVFCGKLVQNYKSKCKIRLSQIKVINNRDSQQIEKNIMIEDSD